MASTPDEPTTANSPMFPFASLTRPSIANPLNIGTPYNPLSHWGNSISTLRNNPYMSSLHRTAITNTEQDETNINTYHNPRTKHYQESMDKQRLEHILFAGDQTSHSLHQQKERMRQKLLENNKRKNNKKNAIENNTTHINTQNNENNNNSNGQKKNNFTQQKKNKKNKNKNNNNHINNNKNNGNKKKYSKQKNKNKKNNNKSNGKKNSKKSNSKSPSQESQKTTDSNSNSVHILELDLHSQSNQTNNQLNNGINVINDNIDMFGDGDGESESMHNEMDTGQPNESICNGYTIHNTVDNIINNNNIECMEEMDGNMEEKQDNNNEKLNEIIESQNKDINILKQNVLILSETVNKLRDKLDKFECMNEIKGEILSLKKRVNDIECMNINNYNNNNINHEQVREWLKNEVNLEQYYHIFIDNGFEDMLSLRTLNMDILNNIRGIDKIGHKSKILYFVTKLNEHQYSTHEF